MTTPALTCQWRALHSYWFDAVLSQDDDLVDVIANRCGGLGFTAFLRSLHVGRLQIRSLLNDSGELVYRVEILGDDGKWHGVVSPPATVLGIDPAEALPLEQALWVRDLREQLGDVDGEP